MDINTILSALAGRNNNSYTQGTLKSLGRRREKEKVEGGRWKGEGGRWKVEGGRWKVEGGRWKMEDGRWKMEDGRWKMEDGRWKMEDRDGDER
jgi:hypothetical protein